MAKEDLLIFTPQAGSNGNIYNIHIGGFDSAGRVVKYHVANLIKPGAATATTPARQGKIDYLDPPNLPPGVDKIYTNLRQSAEEGTYRKQSNTEVINKRHRSSGNVEGLHDHTVGRILSEYHNNLQGYEPGHGVSPYKKDTGGHPTFISLIHNEPVKNPLDDAAARDIKAKVEAAANSVGITNFSDLVKQPIRPDTWIREMKKLKFSANEGQKAAGEVKTAGDMKAAPTA